MHICYIQKKRKIIDIRNFIILYLICMSFGCLYFEEMY